MSTRGIRQEFLGVCTAVAVIDQLRVQRRLNVTTVINAITRPQIAPVSADAPLFGDTGEDRA
jgi:hypothetical protein